MLLTSMTAEQFEILCCDNPYARVKLSKELLTHFEDLTGFTRAYETASEFGGFFPVTCEFIPEFTENFTIMLNSPGEENSRWSIVKCMAEDGANIELYTSERFDPIAFNSVIVNERIIFGIPSAHGHMANRQLDCANRP